MLRTALRPRFLGLLALMVAATVVCGLLATWQWDRAHRAITDRVAGPVERGDVRDVLDPGDPVTNEIVGDIVTATGTYEPAEQIVVPGRSIDGTEAVIVVTALHVDQEDGSVVRLPVARGWIPADEVSGQDGQVDPDLVPGAPEGTVEVVGRLEAGEAATGGITGGVAGEIATTQLVNAWGSPMYAGYLAQVSPADGLQPMPVAETDYSRGLDWQNIGYSFQWVLFGGFFLYLWWRSVRTAHLDELAERRAALEERLGTATGREESSDPLAAAAPADDGRPVASRAGDASEVAAAPAVGVASTSRPTSTKDA